MISGMPCGLVLVALALVSFSHAAHLKKQLAGPPSEFSRHVLPTPEQVAITSRASTTIIHLLADTSDTFSYSKQLFVDSPTGFSLTVVPFIDSLQYSLVDPHGNTVPLEQYANKIFVPFGDDGGSGLGGFQYNFENPTQGVYKFTATASSLYSSLGDLPYDRHGAIVLWNDDNRIITTHTSSLNLQVGDAVGLVTSLVDVTTANSNGSSGTILQEAVLEAKLQALLPDGALLSEQMKDDGLHNDGLANDGVWGATFVPKVKGTYALQATVLGKDSKGMIFRTSEHMINVIENRLALSGQAFGSIKHIENRLLINLELEVENIDLVNEGKLYRPYVQLWGTHTTTGELVPVCWASNIGHVSLVDDVYVAQLEVDMKWITRAAVEQPYVLQQVSLQDASNFVPLSTIDSIPLDLSSAVHEHMVNTSAALLAAGYVDEVTDEMRRGVMPDFLLARLNGSVSCNPGRLTVLHGFCSGGNPFIPQSNIFTNSIFFNNPNASQSHEQFANSVLEFIQSHDLCSFGLMGHSQGGLVSLHILNYYWSGIDIAQGERKIQSLGSPYHGQTAAGLADLLAKLTSSQCSGVYDLTREGAELWLSGITTDAMSQANFYTTQYASGGLFGQGYCNMLMNSFIERPNDGAVENSIANPPLGTNRGNVEGQCHTGDMNWPPSYADEARNQEMSAAAAR